MGLLNFSRKAHENAHPANPEVVAGSTEADADIDMREVYFLIMYFLSSGPCQRTFGQIWNELLEHDLLPRRYHAWHSRSGSRSGNEDDNGHSLPLSYTDLVSRHPHIEANHLVKLLKQLILCSSSSNGSLGGTSTSGIDISSLLGSGAFSLLGCDKTREVKKATHLPLYLRWPHIQANQVHGLSLREIGGGFSKHCRAPSIRAACYAIAKPSTMVQKMEDIRTLRGHQNAVYCAIFDRFGRHVITGSDDRLVKIWSMETAFCLSSCRGHEGDITDLAVSSNNALVASASNDFSIRIWRLPDGLPISVLKGHTGGVTAIAFSPRPVTMYHLLSSSDDGTCRIWDSRYSNPSLRVYVPKPPDVVPGRSNIATFSSVPQVHQILCCAYNASGTVFVTGSSDTYARVWSAAFRTNAEDAEQPNHEMDLLSGHENDVNYVQFSGCAVSSKLSTGDTSKEDNLPKFKNSWFTHDNIVTCSRDGSAIIWIPRSRRSHGKVGRWTRAYHLKVPAPPMPPQPPRGGPRQRSQPAPRGVNMIVWSLDNRFVLAAIMDCRICVWNASDGSLVHSLIGHSESTFVLDVHPFNPRIAMSAGYDGKTIIWDIWEGKPVRTYETGRFKLVDGKFSPDGTSVVLSDEVGQIFIIATGQGESQKDAKYDQFFLGDFRPLMQDTHGNTLDQETQLTPYRRNMQDLLCDSSMIPYPEPYQSEYQRRRLGALGIEWRPPSLKFAVGPSNNSDTGEYHQILPIVDLERWIESLEAMPEFVDAMDWEQENEVQSDDNDSEYNVTEEFSSGREHFSLTASSSGDLGSTGEESEGNHSGREGLRRSRRKNSKAEIAFTTSSGRKVKRRNLDEHDDPTTRSRKRKRRNGGSNSKKGSSKSKLHRPQRRAAQNARTFLSQMGGASSEGEEDDDYDTYSSDNDSRIPESYDHSNDSDRSLFDSCAEVARAKEIKKDGQDVSQSSLNEAYSSVGSKRRLVLRLPVRNPKKILSSENAISISDKLNDPIVPSAKCGSTDDKQNEVYSSFTGPGDSCMEKSNNLTSQYATDSILEAEDTGKKENQSDIAIGCNVGKVRWGEVKTRTAKRVRTGDSSMTDTWHICSEDPHSVTGVNGRHISENGFRASSSSSHPGNQANGDSSFKCERHSEEQQLTDCNQDATNVTQNQEPVSVKPLVLDHVSANADLIQTDVHAASSNGTRRKIDRPDELSVEGFRDSDARQLSSHSQDREGNAEPTIRRMIKFTSKRSICDIRSSFSKCTPDINDQRNLDGDLNGTTQAPDNMIPEVAEEDTGSSGSSDHGNWINGSRKFSRTQSSVCGRTRSYRGKRSAGEDLHIMEENTSKFGNHDDNQYVAITDNSTAKVHFTRSSGARAITDTLSSSRRRGNYDSAEDAPKIGRSSDASDQLHDERRSTRRLKVGLRSSRNTRENYVTFRSSSLDKGKGHYLGKKISWLMLAEHDEGYRYIPQLGDEVAYLRQGHAEYLAATKSHESGPWKSLKGELRAVEFCKVVLLDYSTLPGSGESCCKLTLEIVDPSSRFVGKSFRLTLPELVGFPDFLVERTRYNASIERNWTHRDKCRVWWRDGDNEGGQWYEGRITSAKAKSNEFPESPWDRYIIQYKNDSSGQHPHSPWELHDADRHWEHPHIEEEDRRELLSSFHKIEQTTQRNKDSHGLLKLNQATQKSEFLNRFPVPLSLEVIKRRLENNYYRTVEAVKHDIMVMLSNAESYFSKSAEYAAKMRKLRELMTRTFETKQGHAVL